ncbi:unnamed protein product [Cunninghamella blakesleeana]
METLQLNENTQFNHTQHPIHVSTENNLTYSPAMSPQPMKTTTMNTLKEGLSLHHHLEQENNISYPTKLLKEIEDSYLDGQKKETTNHEMVSLEKEWLNRQNGIYQTVIPNEDEKEEATDVSFWQQFIDHDYLTILKQDDAFLSTLQKQGIPNSIRGILWQIMAKSNSTHLQQQYDQFLDQTDASLNTFSKYANDIDQDIKKSFGFRYPQPILNTMARILKAYTIYNTQFIYTTSSIFILLPLLKHMNESQAFCLFVKLMELGDLSLSTSYKIENHQQQQKLSIKLFDILLEQYCPQLVSHFKYHHIHTKTYVGQWYQTLFTMNLPDKMIDRLYDLIFIFGSSFEIISRVGIALLSRSESHLLKLTGSESFILTLCTRKLYDMAYDDDNNDSAFMKDVLQLGTTITHDRILNSFNEIVLLEKQSSPPTKVNQLMNDEKKKGKRESWFQSWSSSSNNNNNNNNNHHNDDSVVVEENEKEQNQKDTFLNELGNHHNNNINKKEGDQTTVLHQQIEDLVCALSQLQKEHSHLSQEMMTFKTRDMDYQVEQAKLQKRNLTLEKKVKKYKLKLSEQQQQQSVLDHQDENYRTFVDSLRLSGQFGALVAGALINEPNASSTTATSTKRQSKQKRQSLKTILDDETSFHQQEYPQRDRHSSTSSHESQAQPDDMVVEEEEKENHSKPHVHEKETIPNNDTITKKKREVVNHPVEMSDYEKQTAALHSITSELVSVKLANFEMGQKYEQLFNKYNDMEQLYTKSKQQISSQSIQLEELERTIEQLAQDRDQYLDEQVHLWTEEQESLLQENEDWMEKALAAKNTAKELHLDKLGLMKQVERLERRIEELETEKREYLLPTSNFTDEVFATHKFIFGQSSSSTHDPEHQEKVNEEYIKAIEEYRTKYVDTDLRCRELEKLLAEAKVKIAEYEAFNSSNMSISSAASSICSPRASLQHRASFTLQMKRASIASYMTTNSMNNNNNNNNNNSFRVNTPTSPTTRFSSSSSSGGDAPLTPNHHRLSNESCISTTSSATSMGSLNQQQQPSSNINKRSSMYAKICSTFGMNTNPTTYNATDISTTMKDSIVYDEPQPI